MAIETKEIVQRVQVESGNRVDAQDLPQIALVGRPNVGKSTLFNRLSGRRQALVADVPGTTRDRRERVVQRDGLRYRLVDTGGKDFGAGLAFSAEVEAQIGEAVSGADYVWIVLDGKEGLNPFDTEMFRWVERMGKPFRIVVNKLDNAARRAQLVEFYALGSDRVHGVSAEHGLGVTELLQVTAADLPAMRVETADVGEDAETPDDSPDTAQGGDAGALRVAFLGRPNVGKSSLVNRVLGRGRMIVSDRAGTTREAVETEFHAYGQDFVLVDTAGIRRKARTEEHLEKIGVLQSLGALNWVQVAVLVVDVSDEIAAQDARIARYIQEHRRAVVVAMNKWDTVGGDARRAKEVEADVREKLRFLDYATFVRTSAQEGSGLRQLFRAISAAAVQFSREIQTADLNRMVQAAAQRFPPPAQGRSPTRIYYGSQIGTAPPMFRFFTNHPEQIDQAYTRFFENQLRHHFGLEGTPLRIDWRSKHKEAPSGTRRAAADRNQAARKRRR